MNEEAKEILMQLLEDGANALKEGAIWIGGEVPLLIQEVLIFNGIRSGLFALLSLVVLYGCYRLGKYGWQYKPKGVFDDTKTHYIIVTCISAAISITALLWNVLTLAKIIFAPRLYLLEYAASVVK